MTGESGRSRNGAIHQYYKCVTRRNRGNCNKATVKKQCIEDLVVSSVLAILTDDTIDDLARKISELSVKESNTDIIKRLKKLLKENEEATANLVKAIESGKAVDVLSAQIEKRQAEHVELEIQLTQERMTRPVLTYEEVRFFFERFKHGNINDYAFRTALIDVLVDRIYLYDGDDARVEIHCNASDKHTIPLKGTHKKPITESNSGSVMEQLARQERLERPTPCLEGRCSILLSYGRA